MGLPDVSTVLWRERELLELLLFKLEEEQLVLTSGRTRWLAHATREVEMVIAQIRQAEVERAVLVDALAAELGLPPSPSLTALAEAASAPWDDLLTSAQRASREVLGGMDPSAAQTYSPRGTEAEPARARVVDRAL